MAKGLGGGFPIGACLATREAAKGMTPGSHGSTFGGIRLQPASAMRCSTSCWLRASWSALPCWGRAPPELAQIHDQHPSIIESIRGEGLMFGVKTRIATLIL